MTTDTTTPDVARLVERLELRCCYGDARMMFPHDPLFAEASDAIRTLSDKLARAEARAEAAEASLAIAEKERDALSASLSVQEAGAEPVGVKALEWVKSYDGARGSERREQWRAETPFEDYFIWHYRFPADEEKNGPQFSVTPFKIFGGQSFGSFDEAKAAAQADYEKRIRSALTPPHAQEAGAEPIIHDPDLGWMINTEAAREAATDPSLDRRGEWRPSKEAVKAAKDAANEYMKSIAPIEIRGDHLEFPPDVADGLFEAALRSAAPYLGAEGMGWSQAYEIAQRGFQAWVDKPHNRKWAKRLDGTPIPNDLLVNIAEAFAASPSHPENGR